MRRVRVVATGTANTASVLAGLRRAGAEPELVSDPAAVEAADYLVLPGVGAFGAARARLDEADLVAPLTRRLRAGRPTLTICLGLQLLAEGSEESPGVPGLGVIPGTARRFGEDLLVPHMGWNRIAPEGDARFLREGHAYFANSYRLTAPPPGWAWASCDYGGRFVAAIERAGVLACQFHPELSGRWGLELLERWLEEAPAAAREAAEVASC